MLGIVADDVTGGADLAGMLTSRGARTLLCVDQTHLPIDPDEHWDAVVMALKTRSIAADEAVARSLRALGSLRRHGARQVFFKYCSTFDSTEVGNIGPVLDALLAAMGASFSCLVPALPINARTQYLGHLFVNGRLLSESSMRNHPLNPMHDSDLVRLLRAQTRRGVGLVPLDTVRRGPASIRAAVTALSSEEVALALVDAIDDGDLMTIAEAFVDDPLVSGSSGLALALPDVWQTRGLWRPDDRAPQAPPSGYAPTLILCGSCSSRTGEQVAYIERLTGPVVHLETAAMRGGSGNAELARVLATVGDQLRTRGWSLVASCAGGPSPAVAGTGEGQDPRQAPQIEAALARLALLAVSDLGVRSLLVAGGETAGAVARVLNLSTLRVGPQLDPGVPVCYTREAPDVAVVFKSGNFGKPDLFPRALQYFGHSL
jgi:uncharacterized protein YgbK (DUF1537 family)